MRNTPAPTSLSRQFPEKLKVLRTATAAIGPRGASCFVVFLGKPFDLVDNETEVSLRVFLPRARGTWILLRAFDLGELQIWTCHQAQLRWLEPARKRGPVLVLPFSEGQAQISFATGWTTQKPVWETN